MSERYGGGGGVEGVRDTEGGGSEREGGEMGEMRDTGGGGEILESEG